MENKNFVVTTFLIIISSNVTFSIRIDDFSEPNSPYPRTSTSTDLMNVCSVNSAQINRTVRKPNGAINLISFFSPENSAIYSGSTLVQFDYSLTEGIFDLSPYPIFQVNFAPGTIFTDNPLGIKINLTDQNGNEIEQNNFVSMDQQIFDFTTEFKDLSIINPREIKNISARFNTWSSPDHEIRFDFTLNGIEAVPEPISIITLGTGIATFIRKKRKIKSPSFLGI